MPPATRQRLREHRLSKLGRVIYVHHNPESTGAAGSAAELDSTSRMVSKGKKESLTLPNQAMVAI